MDNNVDGNYDVSKVLLLEDNPFDVDLVKECLQQIQYNISVYNVENGVDALHYLDENELPHLILTDLKMPKMDGHEFLRTIKSNKKYKKIPVVVLSTSEAFRDIDEAYAQQASSYVIKPIKFVDFVDILSSMFNYYFNIVKLPKI